MSEQQPTSWRDRFFGGAPAAQSAPPSEPAASPDAEQHPDERPVDEAVPTTAPLQEQPADDASTSVAEHDAHQPLVEHDSDPEWTAADADTAVLDAHAASADADADHGRDAGHAAGDEAGDDRTGDSPIEPTVIAPSALRGPSHSAAHPDDAARRTADEVHGEAAESSLANPEATESSEPPELVEPRRPSFGLRRRSEAVGSDDEAADAALADDTTTDASDRDRRDDESSVHGAGAAGLAGLAGAGAAAGSRGSEREFVEPEPTQALATHEQPTRAMDVQGDSPTAAQTQVLDAQRGDAVDDDSQRTERFGIIRDEVPASSIPVDDETARAAASGGTPIVLVEEPMPPRRKGARGVGFAVALLATLIFGIVFAAAYFAVGFLFDRDFNALETLESVWLRPSFLLPVVVFFLAYWILTLLVNRAGWWAHVLGGFVVALLVYAAHIGGAFMEEQGGWAGYTALPGIDPQALSQLLLAPLSVLAFVVAREVPIWVGGIVARRGRKAREWNRKALDDFNAEHAERLAAYERARG
ncbi:DMT family transporter [Agrococcus sp. Marseille-P2731]|uniref:DMT family transporter n=1 Tax=Agrococcus sp. Marseille-P2731 TaxID=1841862 RepID=UPI000930EB43|nr:DMT family transporter [Agrococcus sp. Marseille-P2731]